MSWSRALVVAIVVAGHVACGGCDSGTGSNNNNDNHPDGGVPSDGAAADTRSSDAAGGGDTSIPGLTELRIDPPEATVTDDGVAPGETTTYRALGMVDGMDVDVTDDVAWTIANEDLGEVVDGEFTSAGIGGASTITATSGSESADAQITVMLEASDVDPMAPPAIADLFDDDTSMDVDEPSELLIVYPSHETMFPRNLERVTYQWLAPNLDAFELRFQSDVADVRFYTDQIQFLPTPAGWRWLADTHAGSSVTLTVRGLSQDDPSTIYTSQSVELLFSNTPVLGALFYWSTGAQGVMKAHISSPNATKFYSDPAMDDNACVSCHTVARNGTKMFVNYDGENAQTVSVPDRDVLMPPPDGEEHDGGWATFNPDASRVLLSAKGELILFDADTGQELSQVTLPPDTGAQHPDWAPTGDYVVVAYGESGIGNKDVEGTSIARIPVNGDTFGDPEVLVPSADDDSDTLCFPSYSPNSEWIAYARTDGKSKDAESAELFLIAADGSGEPIQLTRLNERVRHEDGIVEIGNAMPTWAPSIDPSEPFFLAFSSLRWYGHIREDDNDQLWGAAVDFDLIGQSDPSYAAFWMPFQDLEEGNHRAFWVIDTEEECPSEVEICDGIDNTCDGVVDEDCCTIEPEQCGDAVDNDCDGAIDEGCGCTWPEVCDDGIDNDCDQQIDLDDVDCQDCVPAGGMCEEDNDCCSRVCGNGTCIVN